MKNQHTWIPLALSAFMILGSACTTLPRADEPPIESIQALKSEVMETHSPQLLVSTQVLKSLLSQERSTQKECRKLHGKLEAIKNIDLEGAPL